VLGTAVFLISDLTAVKISLAQDCSQLPRTGFTTLRTSELQSHVTQELCQISEMWPEQI